MPIYITKEEFEARVGVLEHEVEGEKLVTRYIFEQTRRNGEDLAAMRVDLKGLADKVGSLDSKVGSLDSKVGSLDSKVGSLESRVGSLESKVGAMDAKLTGLIHSLPTMIAEAVREGLRASAGVAGNPDERI